MGANVKPTFVNPNEPIYMGRSKSSTIVLASPYVSRRHAWITYINERYMLNDIQSTNGTYVNHEKVDQHELRNEDKIRIGSFVLNFLDRTTMVEKYGDVADILSLDEMITAEIRKGPDGHSDMMGRLNYLTPVEIIQLLNMGRKTGVLTIVGDGGKEGTIKVRNGEIYAAELALHEEQVRGDKAVYYILKMNDGEFVFKMKEMDEDEDNTSIELSTMNLLMEGCRLIDEGKI